MKGEIDLSVFGRFFEGEVHFVHEFNDVVFACTDRELTVLGLAKLHQFVDQVLHKPDVATHTGHAPVHIRRRLTRLHDRIYLTGDDGQRCTEFVCDIGEETQLRLVDSL